MKALLGEGGMGTVYLAQHSVMGWPAAIKVLRRSLADDKVLVRRFINEARVIRTVRHPNIVEILDVGILPPPDERPYLLMELLEGETVGQRLARCGRLDLELAIDIACQTAEALAEAHAKGITHRDLKPENLFLLTDEANPGRVKVKVLDFGIAKLRAQDGRTPSAHTRSGMLLGTPAYMSPEQCRGISDAVDHRADIYALSVILYQMLSGKLPFVSAGTGDVLIMHISVEAPAIGQEDPTVPGFVEAAILRGMAKSPQQRFQSMTELAKALRSGPPEPVKLDVPAPVPVAADAARVTVVQPAAPMPTPISWSGSPGLSPPRRPWRLAAVGLPLAIGLVLMVVSARNRRAPDRPLPADPASEQSDPSGAAAARPSGSPVDPVPPAPPVSPPAPPNAEERTDQAAPPPASARKPARRTRAVAAGNGPQRSEAHSTGVGRGDAGINPSTPGTPAGSPATPAGARPIRKAKPWL